MFCSQAVQESSQDRTPPDDVNDFEQQLGSLNPCNKTSLDHAMNSSVLDNDNISVKNEDNDALIWEITQLGLCNDGNEVFMATGTGAQQQVDNAEGHSDSSDQIETNSISHNELTPENSYQCDICHKMFRYPSHLTRHRDKHTGTKRFTCDVCGKAFTESGNLYKHKRAQHAIKPFVCDKCNWAFSSASSLDNHKVVHSSIKQFMCDICGREFKRDNNLKVHKRTHNSVEQFGCTVCKKTFTQRRYLVAHTQIHSRTRSRSRNRGSEFVNNMTLADNSTADIDDCNTAQCYTTVADKLTSASVSDTFEEQPDETHISLYMSVVSDNEQQSDQSDVSSNVSHSNVMNTEHVDVKVEDEEEDDDDDYDAIFAEISNRLYAAGHNNEGSEVLRCTDVQQQIDGTKPIHNSKSSDQIPRNSTSSHESHTTEKSLECDICHKTFKYHSYLSTHKQLHTISRDKPHVCHLCQKAFSSSAGLSRHSSVHSGFKLFSSDVCHSEGSEMLRCTEVQQQINGTEHIYNSKSSDHIPRNSTSSHETHTTEKSLECDTCHKTFKHRSSLSTHKQLHTTGRDKPHVCELCKKAFSSAAGLNRHSSVHSGIKAFSCDICQKAFSERGNLLKHKRAHRAIKPLKPHSSEGSEVLRCTNVQQQIDSTKRKSSDHIPRNSTSSHETHTTEKSLECDTCHKTFKHRSYLSTHKQLHTTGRDKPHVCELCKKAFSSAAGLNRHSLVHSGIKPFGCDVCQKAFSERGNLLKHKRSHHSVKSYMCEICSKVFNHFNKLALHKLSHDSGAKIYACNICPKEFRSSSHLSAHKATHPGVKPYVCNVCNKAFGSTSELNRHGYVHSGIKPFGCDICQKAFSDRSNLLKHKRAHSGFKPFVCNVCNWAFSNATGLDKHMLVHSSIKQFMCDICGRKFRYESNLKVHKLTHDSVKRFGCDMCNRMFRQPRYLVAHKRIHSRTEMQHASSEFVQNMALAEIAEKLKSVNDNCEEQQPDDKDVSSYVSHSSVMNSDDAGVMVDSGGDVDNNDAIFREIRNQLFSATIGMLKAANNLQTNDSEGNGNAENTDQQNERTDATSNTVDNQNSKGVGVKEKVGDALTAQLCVAGLEMSCSADDQNEDVDALCNTTDNSMAENKVSAKQKKRQ